MCYMDDAEDVLALLARVSAETDRLRIKASNQLRDAVGLAADRGLTQKQIANAIGRSQPEVSRLIRTFRASRFRPTTALGRVVVEHRDQILALARTYRATNVRVFGSLARGEDDDASDIDLLVDLEPGADLLDLATLDIELERLLGHRVDIVPARLLKPKAAVAAAADAKQL
jgi:predicted nucleotidyltransferase/predicted XRE-type DNA-binding protein